MSDQLPTMRYTLCFLTRDCPGNDGVAQPAGEVLMLHRKFPPNQGLWNGVGGRLEPGESPRDCILREVREETGYEITDVDFRGVLTWDGFETPPGGLYIFTAGVLENEGRQDSWECPEGRLEWKPREWVFSSPEVVSNIPVFGPLVMGGAAGTGIPLRRYHFSYRDGKIVQYKVIPLSIGWNVE
ncbi:MAG: 8-oxo-dGTP diphosphatase [Chloroflexi bacterium]|nr:MAG: 8-oxo-dGTP diphosphatase [Chloroflexota bacterium]